MRNLFTRNNKLKADVTKEEIFRDNSLMEIL